MNHWINTTLALLVASTLTGCANPPPECAPKTEKFRFCSDEDSGVYECPIGTDEQISHNAAIDEECENLEDIEARVQCTFDADYMMVEATLVKECTDGCDHFSDQCLEDLEE